jgi:hypothetical protein
MNKTTRRMTTVGLGLALWLSSSVARADFSAAADAGPEFGWNNGVFAGATATLTMGGEWDERHRLSGKLLLLIADPLERPRLLGTTYGGALLMAYRFRPGWPVEPYFELAAGLGLMGGELGRVGDEFPTPIGGLFTGAGGVRVGFGDAFAFYAQLQARGWIAWEPAALWGVAIGLEI